MHDAAQAKRCFCLVVVLFFVFNLKKMLGVVITVSQSPTASRRMRCPKLLFLSPSFLEAVAALVLKHAVSLKPVLVESPGIVAIGELGVRVFVGPSGMEENL